MKINSLVEIIINHLILASYLLSFYSLNLFYISLRAASNLFPADKPSSSSFLANIIYAEFSFCNDFLRITFACWGSNFLNINLSEGLSFSLGLLLFYVSGFSLKVILNSSFYCKEFSLI
jgi:hypothetical protein